MELFRVRLEKSVGQVITQTALQRAQSLLIPNTNTTHGETIATLQNEDMTNEKNKASKAKTQKIKKKKREIKNGGVTSRGGK
jgi:hypothetical protein